MMMIAVRLEEREREMLMIRTRDRTGEKRASGVSGPMP